MKTSHTLPILAAIPGLALAPALSPAAVPDDAGFERYEVILMRKPFGDVVLQPEPEPPPPPGESFAKNLRICSITQPEGRELKVGFVDLPTEKSFMLQVGEQNADGIELISADLIEEEAVVQKGTEIVLMKLAEGTATPISGTQLAARPPARKATTYLDRKRERKEARAQRAKNREALEEARRKLAEPKSGLLPGETPEDMHLRLRDYNLEAIRQGLPPLPIELTAQEDAQLVAEGVLEPIPGQVVPAAPLVVPGTPMYVENPAYLPQEPAYLPQPEPGAPDSPAPGLDLEALGQLPLDQMTEEELLLIESIMGAAP